MIVGEIIGVADLLGLDLKGLAAQAITSAFNRPGEKKLRLGEIEVMAAIALIRANNTLEMTEGKPPEAAVDALRAETKSLAQTIALILRRADLDGSSGG